jgi:hypothetical protein
MAIITVSGQKNHHTIRGHLFGRTVGPIISIERIDDDNVKILMLLSMQCIQYRVYAAHQVVDSPMLFQPLAVV